MGCFFDHYPFFDPMKILNESDFCDSLTHSAPAHPTNENSYHHIHRSDRIEM